MMKGFEKTIMLNSYFAFPARMGKKPFVLLQNEGTSLCVEDWNLLTLQPDVAVVAVSSLECFRKSRQLQQFFKRKKVVFAYAPNGEQVFADWLENMDNRFIFLTDFTPEQVAVYQKLFENKGRGRCSFFLPKDIIAKVTEKGDPALYNSFTLEREDDDPQLQLLIDTMTASGKGYALQNYLC